MLSVSIPTAKRMVEAGTLEAFRTPGGHTRVFAASVEAVKEQRRAQARPVRDPSPVLRNRRERVEELSLEAQELKTRRDLDRLKARRRWSRRWADGRREIEQRQAEQERQAQKARLVEQGLAEVTSYMLELERAEEKSPRMTIGIPTSIPICGRPCGAVCTRT